MTTTTKAATKNATTGTTVDELGRRRRARAAQTTDPAVLAENLRADYDRWLAHLGGAAGCAHPIRLHGVLTHVDQSTGRITRETATRDLPDGVLYTPCGNRRAAVCAGCAETYRADTYQLVTAGLVGGKGVPASVTEHPCVFLTITAPSFGEVHSHRTDAKGRVLPCHPRRDTEPCEHGAELVCWERHGEDDDILGRPLCLDCYDHPHQAVWNHSAGELWRRTRIAADRNLHHLEELYGTDLRLSYTKVAEFQHRGAVHFHALVRLDGRDRKNPEAILTPDTRVSAGQVAMILRDAVHSTGFTTAPHPARPQGWEITWGEQCDPRPVRLTVRDLDENGHISSGAVAGYLAKYATKATELAGHASTRLRADTVRRHTDRDTHVGRQIDACWRLGERPTTLIGDDRDAWDTTWGRLQRWAHMLGFGGHFSTRSRRYSTTLTGLRQARRDWQRAHTTAGPDDADEPVDEDTTEVIVASLAFAGIGWHTSADALLANTAAANAREQRRAAREEAGSMSA